MPSGDDCIDGKCLPGRIQIGESLLGIQRLKFIYGPDADHFRPERWTEASPEKAAKMASTVSLIFPCGKWYCIGKSVVLMEFYKIFVEVRLHATLMLVVADRHIALPQV